MASNYLQLLLYKTYADLKSESQRTYAGFFWWFAEPVISMAIYYVVFVKFFHHNEANYVPFLLVGLVIWRWFHVCLSQGASAILNGRRLLLQLYVPKHLFHNVVILGNSYKFLFSLAVLLLFLWVYGLPPTHYYLALPLVLIIQLMFIMACTGIAAALTPFLPDLKIVIDNLLRGVMFLSGVFYAGSIIPEKYQFYFYLNPMAVFIESYRNILIDGTWPHWERLTWITVASMAGIAFGRHLLSRFDYSYPKVVQG